MSHLVQIKTEIRDSAGLFAACRRLNLAEPMQGIHKLYSSEATGLSVQLRGWRYPVVCDIASGKIEYDNFGGLWGQQAELDQLLQFYAVEKAKIEARKKGHSVTEQPLADGSIKLAIQVTRGAA